MLYIPKRFIFAVLAFFGILIIIAIRVNMSIAIVAMVNRTSENSLNGTVIIQACPNLWRNETQITQEDFKGSKYNWNPQTQGLILSSFYYGNTPTQLPGGVLGDKLGAKWLYGGGVLTTSILFLLIPVAATWGAAAVITVRILQGLGEGLTLPAVNHAISKWSPKFERSRMSSFIFMGFQIGNIIGSPISGYLSSADRFGGWPSTFYLFGIIGCVWFVLWYFLMHETPESHPSITKEELSHIQKNKSEQSKTNISTPWKDILFSVPVWAVVAAHFAQDYTLILIMSTIPTYLETILHFNIKTNGFISGVPYVFQAIIALFASYCADKLIDSKILSVTAVRKVCNTIGFFGPAVCFLGITMAECQSKLVVALLWLAVCLNGFVYSGYNVTHIDMSPDFAGVLYGTTNTLGNIGGVLGPLTVGYLTANGETVENWNKVFYIKAAVYFVCGSLYAIFASAELQPWGLATRETQRDDPKRDKIYFIEEKN